jgi:hypothetical protein
VVLIWWQACSHRRNSRTSLIIRTQHEAARSPPPPSSSPCLSANWQHPRTSQHDPHRYLSCTYSLLWLRSQGQHFGRSRRYPLRHSPLFGLCPWPLVAPLATLKPHLQGLSPWSICSHYYANFPQDFML